AGRGPVSSRVDTYHPRLPDSGELPDDGGCSRNRSSRNAGCLAPRRPRAHLRAPVSPCHVLNDRSTAMNQADARERFRDLPILEGVVTTANPDGTTNISPMGPRVDWPTTELLLRPYPESTTSANLTANPR